MTEVENYEPSAPKAYETNSNNKAPKISSKFDGKQPKFKILNGHCKLSYNEFHDNKNRLSEK